MRKRWWPLVMLVIAVSCDENREVPASYSLADFFPMKTGVYHIYAVDEITYQQNVATTLNYELKTLVADSFRNEEGGYTYIIQRFKRTSPVASWIALPTWSARITNSKLIVNEGNIPYVLLTVPFVSAQMWNGNEYNTQGGDERCGAEPTYACDRYEIMAINESFITSESNYENALTVVEHNNADLLVKNDVRKKIYVAGTGLVYSEKTILNYCTNPPACFGRQFIDSGIRYKQILKSSGVEK